jgi:hypothetical protein
LTQFFVTLAQRFAGSPQRNSGTPLALSTDIMASFEFPRGSAGTASSAVRAEVSVDVATYLSGNLQPVELQRVTLNGCRLQSETALVPGSIQQLRVTTPAGRVMTMIIRVGSCRPPMFGPQTSWINECTFAHADAPSVKHQIASLLEEVTPVRRVA